MIIHMKFIVLIGVLMFGGKMNNQKKEIYYKDNCWNLVYKEVDFQTHSIRYVTRNGYLSEESAKLDYTAADCKFKEDIKILKRTSGIEYSFCSYLEYWFQSILKKYAYASYVNVCEWAIFYLIIPKVENDPFLNFVTPTYINNIITRCETACKSAGHSVKKVLSVALKDATRDGFLTNFDFDQLKSCNEDNPPVFTYSKEHLKIFLSEAKYYHTTYVEILLALFCGLRSGEIRGLQKKDFNFKEKTVTISRQVTREYIYTNQSPNRKKPSKDTIRPPKNLTSYRTLRVPDLVLEEVKKRFDENKEFFKTHPKCKKELKDFLCIGKYGGFKCVNTLYNSINNITRKNNLPPLGTHQLRHLYATLLLENGVPLEKVSKLLGHSSVNTTFNYYAGIIDGLDSVRNYINESMDPINYEIEGKCS